MNIILDVDEVVVALIKAICDIGNKDQFSDARSWNFWKSWPEQIQVNIDMALNDHRWWRGLPSISGSKYGVNFLRTQDHNITWASTPYESCFGWTDARRALLFERYNARQDRRIWAEEYAKEIIDGHCIIDDKPEVVEEWQKRHPTGTGFLFSSSHNLDYRHPRRINNWNQLIQDPYFRRKHVQVPK